MFDVIGVGALNLDCLAELPVSRATAVSVIGSPIEWGTETAVGEDFVHHWPALLGDAQVSAGGSSFNTVFALAHARPGLSLGYVGLAGTPPRGTVSAVDELVRVGVDVSVVGHSPRLPGLCLALGHDGDRTLFTHIGANQDTPQYLEERFDELVAYLSQARIVHVTSFLDPQTPTVLLRLLGEVRRVRPDMVLTLDPGHVWCAEPTPDILGLLSLADYVILNRAELSLLEGHLDGSAALLVKAPGGITVRRAEGETVVAQKALAPNEIVDSTGAGDWGHLPAL